MATLQRLGYDNKFTASTTTITASSEETSFTAESLRDPLVTKQWRSDTGWNIVTGVNDALDFDDGGGEENATITAGNYATAAAMNTEIKARMEALTGDTITATYPANKFDIATSGGTLSLLCNSGTNAATSIFADLGYDVSSDKTGSTNYTAADVSYKSREWVKFDLAAAAGLTAIALFNTNGGASDTYTIQAHASDAWTSPTYSQALSGTGALRIFNMASQSYRWWRILIEDTGNTDGYSAIGIASGSAYFQPAKGIHQGHSLAPGDLSEIVVNDSGGVFRMSKGSRQSVEGTLSFITAADKASFITFQSTVGVGGSFVFELDPANDLTGSTYWMVLMEPMVFSYAIAVGTVAWNTSISLLEQIG